MFFASSHTLDRCVVEWLRELWNYQHYFPHTARYGLLRVSPVSSPTFAIFLSSRCLTSPLLSIRYTWLEYCNSGFSYLFTVLYFTYIRDVVVVVVVVIAVVVCLLFDWCLLVESMCCIVLVNCQLQTFRHHRIHGRPQAWEKGHLPPGRPRNVIFCGRTMGAICPLEGVGKYFCLNGAACY
jgi:hypothetical protein